VLYRLLIETKVCTNLDTKESVFLDGQSFHQWISQCRRHFSQLMVSLLLFIFLLFIFLLFLLSWFGAIFDFVPFFFTIDTSYPFFAFLFDYRNPSWTYSGKGMNRIKLTFVWLIFAELSWSRFGYLKWWCRWRLLTWRVLTVFKFITFSIDAFRVM
jgi:hypothetical protein